MDWRLLRLVRSGVEYQMAYTLPKSDGVPTYVWTRCDGAGKYDMKWPLPGPKPGAKKAVKPCKRHVWEMAEDYTGKMIRRCERCGTESH